MSEEYEEEFGEVNHPITQLGLVIGDLNIPMRASDLPPQFKELLVPNKVQYVFCTGNVGNRETQDWLKSLSGNSHLVKGDFDDNKDLPEYKSVKIGVWNLVLCHGHQVWGNSTSSFPGETTSRRTLSSASRKETC